MTQMPVTPRHNSQFAPHPTQQTAPTRAPQAHTNSRRHSSLSTHNEDGEGRVSNASYDIIFTNCRRVHPCVQRRSTLQQTNPVSLLNLRLCGKKFRDTTNNRTAKDHSSTPPLSRSVQILGKRGCGNNKPRCEFRHHARKGPHTMAAGRHPWHD